MRDYVDISLLYSNFTNIGDIFIVKKKNNSPASNVIIDYYNGADQYNNAKEVVALINNSGDVIMSNDKVELLSNKEFIDGAFGDVLIFGLGLGLIVLPLLNDESISSITIVEKEQKIINYVGQLLKNNDPHNKLSIICSDVISHKKEMSGKYDYIYFDIWNTLNEDAFVEMEQFHDLYEDSLKNDSSVIKSWCYEIKDIVLK